MSKSSTNIELSEEDKKAITDGANWLSQWITERYNQGYLSQDEYDHATQNLKDVKVYTTGKGYDKIAEALEKGELHLNEKTIARAAKAYDNSHFISPQSPIGQIQNLSNEQAAMLADFGIISSPAKLTNEQKAIAYFKETLASGLSSSDGLLGFHASFIKEPAIFLDIDKIKEREGRSDLPSLTSLAVHELTHNLHLTQQETSIQQALYGQSIQKTFTAPQHEAVAPEISLQFIAESDTKIETHKGSKSKSAHNSGVQLKEGVQFNSYLDSADEVYARLMQLRYDFGLKPNETFTKEQIDEIEQRAKTAQEKLKTGEETRKVDIDFNIISRYRNGIIQDMLNYTAEEKADVKNALKVQEWQSDRDIAQVQSSLLSESPSQDKPSKEKTQASIIAFTSVRDMS